MKTNLRSVRRDALGVTLLTKVQLAAESLCDYCPKNVRCSSKDGLDRFAKRHDIAVTLSHCPHYQFPIAFRDHTGLSQEHFNTMRLGPAWSRRVQPGDIIAMVDKDSEVIGTAEVQEVILQDKQAALSAHARSNHMVVEQNLSDEEASQRLAKILRNNYGNLVFKNNDQISVIYLKPLQH